MTGLPNLNFEAFNELEEFMKNYTEYEPLNPARNFGGDQTRELREYYAKDFELLTSADAICFLPGWKSSEGARIEYSIARSLGLKMMQYEPLEVGDIQDMDPDDGPVELVAGALVRNGKRQAVYGHPSDDFKRTAEMWGPLLGTPVDPKQVALGMVALKMSRLRGTPDHMDSIVDAIGYMVCYSRLVDGS